MTDSDSERLQRLQPLFDRAVDLPRERWAEFAADACAADEDLARHLLELLAAHEGAGPLVDGARAPRERASTGTEQIEHRTPQRIGRYEVKGVIATGGMGVVYLAEQQQPTRTVAIKVLREGLTSPEIRRRFQYEAEILGQLRHPGIARIYEAGIHEDGERDVPFFAMEYIADARTITRYAEDETLDTRSRVELFVQVCEAVASGHQRGIIHRDLKPDNILVDQDHQIRIIDFGVARSIQDNLAVTTVQTRIGQLVGTLQYMSPEQCSGDPSRIDVRSDVYSLGVVLYELLSGQLPYDVQDLFIPEAVRVVTEQPPVRLSMVTPRLPDDLVTIAHKALEKDLVHRYRSAGGLADDLHRFLHGDAILARRPSMVYHLRVMARRHKTLTASSLAAFLTLTLGIIGTSLGQHQARQQRDRALEALAFGLEIIESVSAALAQGERIPTSVVDHAAAWLDQGACRGQPDLESSFRATIGRAYTSLGRGNQAAPHLQVALALDRQRFGPESTEVAQVLADLAEALAFSSEDPATMARDALRIRRLRLGSRHPDTLRSIDLLSGFLIDRGAVEKAEVLIREALEVRVLRYGEEHPDVARTRQTLGFCRFESNDYVAGEPLMRSALNLQRKLLAPSHLDLAQSAFSLAALCEGKGDPAEAEALLRETLAILDMRLVEDHFWSVNVRRGLARVLLAQGKVTEAEAWYRQLVEQPSAEDAQPLVNEAIVRSGWGECLTRLGRYAEAETQLALARDVSELPSMVYHIRLQWPTAARLATLYTEWGRPEDAAHCLANAEALLRQTVHQATDAYRALWAQAQLGDCLTRMGRYHEAERELLAADDGFTQAVGESHPEIWMIGDLLTELYRAWGRPDRTAAPTAPRAVAEDP